LVVGGKPVRDSDDARVFYRSFLEKHPENASKHDFTNRIPIVDLMASGDLSGLITANRVNSGKSAIGNEVTIAGWVKTSRAQGGLS
jgi:hypothetical protein